MTTIIMPAEAPLDLFKAAYVFYKRDNLRLCNIQFAYPNKAFSMPKGCTLLGMHIDTGGRSVSKFMRFSEVMEHLGDPLEFRFLHQIAEDTFYGFRNRDKTLVMGAVFEFFDNYARTMAELSSADEIVADHVIHDIGNLRVVVQSEHRFITPDERIVLFKNGFHYVVFRSAPAVGIQKNLGANIPTLSGFADHAGLRTSDWFVHRNGHMLVSRSNVTPDAHKLIESFISYLSEFTVASGRA